MPPRNADEPILSDQLNSKGVCRGDHTRRSRRAAKLEPVPPDSQNPCPTLVRRHKPPPPLPLGHLIGMPRTGAGSAPNPMAQPRSAHGHVLHTLSMKSLDTLCNMLQTASSIEAVQYGTQSFRIPSWTEALKHELLGVLQLTGSLPQQLEEEETP